MLLVLHTHVGQKNLVSDRSTYGRHLVNTVERSVLSGDAECCYYTVAGCYHCCLLGGAGCDHCDGG